MKEEPTRSPQDSWAARTCGPQPSGANPSQKTERVCVNRGSCIFRTRQTTTRARGLLCGQIESRKSRCANEKNFQASSVARHPRCTASASWGRIETLGKNALRTAWSQTSPQARYCSRRGEGRDGDVRRCELESLSGSPGAEPRETARPRPAAPSRGLRGATARDSPQSRPGRPARPARCPGSWGRGSHGRSRCGPSRFCGGSRSTPPCPSHLWCWRFPP